VVATLSASIPAALTIAGSDSGGGAGIQADLKTFAACGVYGCSAITAITAQNTQGVDGIWPISPEAVAKQIHSVLNDITIHSIKTGMLYQSDVVEVIIDALKEYPDIPLVVDPVLVATSGDALAIDNSFAQSDSFWKLLTRASIVTPNLNEAAELLATVVACNEGEMGQQGRALLEKGLQGVMMKGGHLQADNIDILLWRDGSTINETILRGEKINTNNTHGTGCTLAAAMSCGRARSRRVASVFCSARRRRPCGRHSANATGAIRESPC